MILFKDLFDVIKVKWIDLPNIMARKLSMSKKFRKIRSASANGEVHFIYEETCSCNWVVEKEVCDEFEARKFSKHEASKPIYLVRE
jgi:hypothetical protein